MIVPGELQAIPLPAWAVGSETSASSDGALPSSIEFQCETLRPPSPVALTAELQSGGDLEIRWVRRSRMGFAWVDGIDAPLGETSEHYQIVAAGSALSLERDAAEATLTISSEEVATLGSGLTDIEVRQVGDFALSHPARLSVNLS